MFYLSAYTACSNVGQLNTMWSSLIYSILLQLPCWSTCKVPASPPCWCVLLFYLVPAVQPGHADLQHLKYLPSNGHISTPFFQKTVFFSKICLVPPSKFLEVCLNSEYMWKWSQVKNFNNAMAIKKLLSAGVEVTSTLPNSDTLQD